MTSSISEPSRMNLIVERLFERFLLMFGKRFTDMWINVDPSKLKNAWSEELQECSLNELKHGLEAAMKLDWPPTLPEFKKLCKRPLNALEAYYEAVKGLEARSRGESFDWTSPAVFWAACSMAFDLMTKSYSAVRAQWDREFDTQIRKNCWPAIPEALVICEYKPDKKRSAELAKHALEWAKHFLEKNRVQQ